ncbi:hypothetical protein [Paraburkholderia tropica]|uniref:hypothetical protein n=1 Tax=Paraburkholderia tropica TaxID=92647 RepID=UPI0007EC9958|nr:hypothetical protein [Paraburkholderia tropica]OBR46241.1 hypothetical protein A6456_38265 [Paraburkholderia tropica]
MRVKLKRRWLFVAIPMALIFLMWEHAGPWIFPRQLTLRVVAGEGHPLSGADVTVYQTTWQTPCIPLFGWSGAACNQYHSTAFDGTLDRHGEARIWATTAVGFVAEPYIACIEGKEYEADYAFAKWPTDPAVSVVTLDYKGMRLLRKHLICTVPPPCVDDAIIACDGHE